jgi:hypothetical protein
MSLMSGSISNSSNMFSMSMKFCCKGIGPATYHSANLPDNVYRKQVASKSGECHACRRVAVAPPTLPVPVAIPEASCETEAMT